MRPVSLLLSLLILSLVSFGGSKKIDSLFQVIQQNKTDTSDTKAYVLLSEIYREFNIDSAEMFAHKAVILSQQRGHKKFESFAHNSLGYVYYFKGDYQSSIRSFQYYYKAAEAIHDKKAMGFAKNNEGNVYIELGDYISAIERYQEALSIRKEAKDTLGVAMSYNNMGYIYKDLGDYEKAISNFLYALRVYESINDKKSIATTYNYLAAVYRRKKDYNLAQQNLNKALEIQMAQQDFENMGISYHSKANVYGDEKKYDSAILFFQKANEMYGKNKDVRQLGLLNADIANVFLEQKKYDSAVVYFLTGTEFNHSIGNKRSQASLFNGLAKSYLGLNKLAQCKTYLDSAFNIIQQTNKKEDFKDYYKVLSEYYKSIGDDAQALQSLNTYIVYKDSLLNAENQKSIADMQIKYDVERKDHQITLQKSELLQRNIMLIGLAILLVLLLLLGFSAYKRQRLNQKNRLQSEIMKQQDIATKAVIEAEENERNRIGSDLHDGVGQLMSAAKMNLSAISDRIVFKSEQDQQAFEKSILLVEEGCKEVRTVSHSIMPNSLLRSGLSNAIKEFIEKLDNRTLKINLHSVGLNERLDSNIETVLYRIIQECVNNVIKHSGANSLDISLIKDDDGISATIEDNGKGFQLNSANKGDGIGLKNIQTRVNYLKGTLDIDTSPGKGTLVAIHVPLV